MLRVGMTNPPFILEHLPEIGAILRDSRVFSYLHVPVCCACGRAWRRLRHLLQGQARCGS